MFRPITPSGGGLGGWAVYAWLVGVARVVVLTWWACCRWRGGHGLAMWSVMALDTPHLDRAGIAPQSKKYVSENSMQTKLPKYTDTIVTI